VDVPIPDDPVRIEDGLGFSLAPWQPVLDQHIGTRISGLMHGDGGVE
jgi:hypothetical protein